MLVLVGRYIRLKCIIVFQDLEIDFQSTRLKDWYKIVLFQIICTTILMQSGDVKSILREK